MITNDTQYETAKVELTGMVGDRSDALRSEVEEYESLRAAHVSMFEASSLHELGALLVSARIARGWSAEQLASAVGVTEEQIERDELDGYRSVSLARAQAIADALGLDTSTWAQLSDLADGPL